MKKRLLSILLVLVMVIGILPTAALAERSEPSKPETIDVEFHKVVQGLSREDVPGYTSNKDEDDIDFDFKLVGPVTQSSDGDTRKFDFELEWEDGGFDDFSYNENTGEFTSRVVKDEHKHKMYKGAKYILTEDVDYPDHGYNGPTEYDLTLKAEPADHASLTEKKDENNKTYWEIVVSGPVTITAYNNYSPKFDVTYSYTGTVPEGAPEASIYDQPEVAVRTDVTVASNPTLDGYTFSGWETNDATVKDGKFTMPAKDVVFTGSWSADEAEIVFETNGGSEVPTMVGTTDAAISNTAMPETTKAGYVLEGWYKTSDFSDNKVTALPSKYPAGVTTYYAKWIKDAEISVEKTVTSVGNWTPPAADSVIPPAQIGDTITWTITISNAGDVAGKVSAPVDKLGEKTLTVTPVETPVMDGDQYVVPAQGSIRFTVRYTVMEADAGKTLTNKVTVGDLSKEAPGVKVELPKHNVTVSYYTFDGTTENSFDDPTTGQTNPFEVTEGDNWSIVIATGTGNYTAPASYTDGTNTYVFDSVKSDALSNKMRKSDVTVKLYYGIDANNDKIPDYYQVTVNYVSEDTAKGTITGKESEVLTIRNSEGKWASTGDVTATGSDATPKDGYYLLNWTNNYDDSKPTSEKLDEKLLKDVKGGTTYTFTAHFNEKIYTVDVEKDLAEGQKTMVKVGETITWTITLENTGNQTLENVTIDDALTIGETERAAGVKVYLAQEEIDSTKKLKLTVGEQIQLTAQYVVTADDVGKTISNTVYVEIGDKSGDRDTAPAVTVENAALNVVKTVDKTTAKVGNKLTYTIKVTNTGNTTLTGIELTDAMLNVTETIGTLAPGESWTENYEYTVKTADAGKTIVNTAVAKASDGTTGSDSSDGTKVQSIQTYVPTLNKKDHVAYIIGYEDNTVRPENNITRAEVATIFFRMLNDNSRARFWSQSNDFSDVGANDWFNNAVSTMANAGVLTGYPDGTFKPNAPITRAEFAAIAARFSDVVYNGKCSFTDVAATHWAADEIALAEHMGWITGYPDDTFRPGRNITRAEAMTLINRVLERAVEEEDMLKDMVKWIDNSPSAWYYEAVQEATNSHSYTRLYKKVPGQNFYYEDWVAILENPDWAALERAWSKANDQ